MRTYHVLTTEPNDARPVSTPGMTLLSVAKMRADAAGDPKLCKSQTIETRDGTPTAYRVVDVLVRISQGERWSPWMDRQEWERAKLIAGA